LKVKEDREERGKDLLKKPDEPHKGLHGQNTQKGASKLKEKWKKRDAK